MITIEIHEEVNTKEDMVYLLEEISRQIRSGNTSGFNPNWSLNESEADPEDEVESARSTADLMDDDSENDLPGAEVTF